MNERLARKEVSVDIPHNKQSVPFKPIKKKRDGQTDTGVIL